MRVANPAATRVVAASDGFSDIFAKMFDEFSSHLLASIVLGQYDPYQRSSSFWWTTLLVLGVVGAVVWIILRSRFDFKIVVKPSDVDCRGAVSTSQQKKIRTYFEKWAPAAGSFTILGRRAQNGRLSLTFRGLPDPGRRQQIRNFLVTLF